MTNSQRENPAFYKAEEDENSLAKDPPSPELHSDGASNRGQRAQPGSGEARGSGAGAGGGGNPEEYDQDTAGGSGAI